VYACDLFARLGWVAGSPRQLRRPAGCLPALAVLGFGCASALAADSV